MAPKWPTKKDADRKTKVVMVLVSPAEKAAIERRARQEGLSISDLVRSLATELPDSLR